MMWIMKYKLKRILMAAVIIEFIAIVFLVQSEFFPNERQYIERFYESNVATLVSPHSLREQLSEGHEQFILVDVREKEDYLRNHIITAINIVPDDNLIINFKELQMNSQDKEILVYCYTHVCMRGKKVGRVLAKNGVYVKELGIGFNEWKNFWREWNYENEWNSININELIISGEEPGELKNKSTSLIKESGCSIGEFGC